MSLPVHRTLLALDIEHSTSPLRANTVQERLRRDLYLLLERALHAADVTPASHDPLIERADGVLVLIQASGSVPKTRLLNPFIPALTGLLGLRSYSRGDHPDEGNAMFAMTPDARVDQPQPHSGISPGSRPHARREVMRGPPTV
jgi:hypothetical protein